MKLEIKYSGVSPKDVCNQAADAISALVNSYSQLYTLRRTPSFVPYFVLTSSIAHAVTIGLDGTGPAALQTGVRYLEEMTGCHGFAKRGLDILYYLIGHWDIDFKFQDHDAKGPWKDVCKPISTSMNLFCPNIESVDSINGISRVKLGENPIFWSYPLQGRPLLDVGTNLEGTGFRLL